ncbi:non-ribosomal peptide synthase/polyketide synthase, partial [Xanthomonas sp. 3058]|uniref:non-ribosomal peptide synthase/polyketide synthase n=1 Tax=Xanthomonas sp. 3058 TaxID=3035314 RepID=UPI0016190B27
AVFATLLFGRMHASAGVDRVLGMFLNTLPIRLDTARGSVLDALRHTQLSLAQLLHHEHAPLALAQRCSPLDPSTPLLNALLNYRYAGGSNVLSATHDDRLQDVQQLGGQDRTHYPLVVSVNDHIETGGFSLDVQCVQEIGAERIAAMLLQTVQVLVQALAQAPDSTLHAVDLLPADERAQLQRFTVTETAPLAQARCIHHLFEDQVRRTPDAIAVLADNVELSYAALEARANQLAHRLCTLGVAAEHRVALYLPRGIEQVVALLATLKAGAAYLPLDPELPDERLAFLLTDSRPRVVLTCGELHERLQSIGSAMQSVSVLTLDLDADADLHDPGAPTIPSLGPDNLAYVIYTSGSTGQPKGTLLTHAGAAHYLQWAIATYRPFPSAVVSSSLAFDATLTSLLAPLLCGARVELLPEHDTLEALRQRLCDPTPLGLVKLTPAHLEVLGQQLAEHEGPLSPAVMVIGGEALPAATLARWQTLAPHTRLINEYGPTETVVGCVVHATTADDALAPSGRVPIGQPIAHLRIHVLDAHGQLAPIGVSGHLHIAGPQLARGYLGRPDLTAERFVPDPFAEQPGQRMYRTGDLACWRADGTLDYLGRNDDQVKLRGFRIELGEIAAALRACPGVHDAAVLLREDTPGQPRLVAYLVGDATGSSADALRTQLATRLPDVMLPTAYVHVDALPLTANGKLDRRALPAPDGDALATQAYLAPEGEREILLAAVWSELLNIERVGRHDSFFALGGHSLLAISLIERLRRHGWQLEVRALFNSPTLAGLASTLTCGATVSIPPNPIVPGCTHITPELLPLVHFTQSQIDAVVATVAGGAANVQDIYPLAPLQEGLLFHHLASPEGDAYLNISVLSFDTRTRLDAFVTALEAVIARHDILRTGFAWQGLPTPVQVVWRHATLPLHMLVIDAPDVLAELRLRMDPSTFRLDVSQAPLIHAHVVEDPAHGRWLLGLHNHHLMMDHTTLELLIEEVQAHLDGQQARLPEPLPFRNFVAQARLGVSEDEHRAFFTQQLGDLETPTAPFGLWEVHGTGADIEQALQPLPEALAAGVRRQARRLNVSPSSLFHLACALVLAQTSGQDDVVFGTTLFGRMQGGSGADRVLGMFLNTLPIRLQRDGRGVADAVRQTQARLAELLHHEHAPLALAQRCSGIAPPAPLFTALLNYRHVGGNAGQTPSQSAHDWHGMEMLDGLDRNNYPLTLSIDDIAATAGFAVEVKVERRIGTGRVVALMLQTVQALVQALEDAPDTALHALHLLPAEECAQLQRFTSTETVPLAQAACIHHLFEDQVRRTPDAIALQEDEVEVSYAVLEARANQLAHRLRTLGVGAESRVALYLPRGIDQVVALLAVLKAGAAYLPLDPELPSERLAFLLADSRPRAVLTCSELQDRLPASRAMLRVSVLTLDTDAHSDLEDPGAPSVPGLCADHLAYVIYTSGSTGQPKGTLLTHAGAAHYLQWAIATYRPFPSAVVSSSLAFDATLTSLLAPLLCGARVELLPEHDTLDALRQRLCDPTPLGLVKLTPAHLEVLGQQLAEHQGQLSPAVMVIGGEALPAATLARWQTLAPHTRLINEYGPTETVVGCVVHDTTREDALDPSGRVPIGQPIAHLRIHVLDAHAQLAPIGVSGQLHIAGPQLARGYLGRPDLTAERFVPDPFAEQPGQRMYRSGDLACWRADGTLDFLGRNDDQVKLRGFRIELGEIAAALRACAGVDDAAVLLREDTPGEPRLVAYLVGDAEQLSADTLRTQLAMRLPEVMLPTAYVHVDALPLTANGKLDRRALPAPDQTGLGNAAHQPPQGQLEQMLAQLWSDLLGVEQVGRHDSFFALGGHSLLGVKLIERLRLLGWQLEVRALFSTPTLIGLAQTLKTASMVSVPANPITAACTHITPDLLPLVALTQAEIDSIVQTLEGGASNIQDIYPLAPLQHGLLYHHVAEPVDDIYLSSTVIAFDACDKRDRFIDALDQVIARHDILRTAVFWEGLRTPVQVVRRHAPLPVQRHRLAGSDVARQLQARLHTQYRRIDLRQAPLLRAHLADEAERGSWLLGLQYHHLVMDHTTLELVVEEVQAHLDARQHLLPEPLPFRDFVAQACLGVSEEEHRAFFTQMLGEVTEPTVPFGVSQVESPLQDVNLALPDALASTLRQQARRLGVSTASLFHLGFALLLAQTSGRDDVVFGTVLFGRLHASAGADRVLGMFLNTLPLRLRRDHTSVEQAVVQTQRLLAQLLHHEHALLAQAQRCSGIQAPAPLFAALFNYRYRGGGNVLAEDQARSEAIWQGIDTLHLRERTHYPLSLAINDDHDSGGFSVDVQASQGLDPDALAQTMAEILQQLAQALAVAPNRPLHALTRLGQAERTQVLEEFNATEAVVLAEGGVHQRFEQQVRQTPSAVAVVDQHGTLSYAELDRQANRLAHHLRSLGAAPGSRIAVALERSADLIVAELAILKCGAAYVPLDIEHPAQRMRRILDECAALLVISHSTRDLPNGNAVRVDMDCLDVEGPTDAPSLLIWPDSAAYVMYTSGSTGTPKGVVIAHRAIVNFACQPGAARILATDRVAFASNPAFDSATLEVWSSLLNGATIVIVPPAVLRDPQALCTQIADLRISVLILVAGVLRAYAPMLSGRLASLRLLITGGDLADPYSHALMLQAPGPDVLLQTYGPTETTQFVTALALHSAPDPRQPVPIGRPLANSRLLVLDRFGQPAPIGVQGALHIGGAQLALGYLGRPDLTAASFVPDPFAKQPGQRMYRTGDLARWRADASLDFLGRQDEQVKIRGFRIELGEVVAALRACAGVRDAVVVLDQDSGGHKRLLAYVVGDTEVCQALPAQLGTSLPDYMLPAAYVQLDGLPLTANGKLDRRALPAPDRQDFDTRAYEPPRQGLEQRLAPLWTELLGVAQLGRHDDFFALGGHSLLAVQLIGRIRAQLGLGVSLAMLFAHPRLADLAQALDGTAAAILAPIVPVPRTGPLPLSFAQQRLWFLGRLDTDADLAYLMPMALRLRGVLHAAALGSALDRIVARHEILRTHVALDDDIPSQRIAPPQIGFALDCVDLSHASEPQIQVRRYIELETSTPFPAERPLARGRLLRLAADDHVLLITLHHLVSDGWSMGILVQELAALYGACVEQRPDPLPPLSLQYADIAAWQRDWIRGDVLQRQRDFWVEHLHGAPTLLDLPIDHPRPPRQDYRGDALDVVLDADLTDALKACCQRHGTTVFMALIAAWGVLLSRLSGQQQVVIGTPVANRHRSEFEPLIGLFANTQALRIDLRGNPSVAELLAQVRSTALAAQEHQDLPFEQVIEALNPTRSLAHHPVFQAMFTWQNTPSGDIALPGLVAESIDAVLPTIKFDLDLSLREHDGRILGSLGYACSLFERRTIERHLAQFVLLLRGLLDADRVRVAQLPLLPAAERQIVLDQVHHDLATPPEAPYVHRLFEAQVQRTPLNIALQCEADTLGYAALDARANQLAHHLIDLGVTPEDRVAVCLPRGIDLVVALLATLKAGAAYLPLDPAYPPARLQDMLVDAQPRVLLAHQRTAAPLTLQTDLTNVLLDSDAATWTDAPTQAPTVAALSPQHPAYVIYTSGSTGRPKGVVISHGALMHFLAALQAQLPLSPEDRLLAVTTVCFDIAGLELFAPLVNGACVLIASEQTIQDPSDWVQRLEQHAVSVLQATPAFWQMLLDAGWHSRPGLRMLCGGEALSQDLAQRLRAGGGQLWNLYGPTEATIWASLHPVLGDEPGSVVPLGRPLAETRMRLLDAHAQLVPLGARGELFIAGPQLARGYLGRPDLTAERFLPDPFAAQPGQRMYKTGDLARWRADGVLDFLGRNDDQVKLRGFRIELGEIAAALRACDDVREAVVVIRQDHPGDTRLVAYVVGDADALGPDRLRHQLALRLPDYMVPAAYVPLEALPLTANGKLDRNALPAPDHQALETEAYEAPRPGLEQRLAVLWAELLGVERVGRNDSFFALGGHSLLATQLSGRVRAALGREVPLATLFDQPRLSAFAQAVAQATSSVLPPIMPVPRTSQLPLSFAQQRLWFLDQLDAGASAAYLMPTAVRLLGALNREALCAALDRLVARHEALRTHVGFDGDMLEQRIASAQIGFALEIIAPVDGADPERVIAHHAALEASLPFDVTRGPLLRGRLVCLGADDHVVFVTLHHMICDGWSMRQLIAELRTLYSAFSQGLADPLPALPIQYADYAVWQRCWITDQTLQRQRQFWVNHLHGAPTLLDLPTDRPRPATQDYCGDTLEFALDASLSEALRAMSLDHGTTLFMTMLAAWASVLARWSNQSSVVIGTPIANRPRSELEPLIGLFANTQALHVDVGDNPTVAELLAQVRRTALAAQEHQDLPFEQVIEALNPPRNLGHHPLFQVMLTWDAQRAMDLSWPHLQTQDIHQASATIKFDLHLSLQDTDAGICGGLSYATALFDRATMARQLEQFVTLLHGMVAEQSIRVGALPLLPASERAQLQTFNTTDAELDGSGYLHRAIEAQARRTPQAIALVEENIALSYAELDMRANQLAHHLIDLGVTPEDRVAVCLPRGIDLVVALLAVLKAGAAYLPLDSDVPAARLDGMLADARPGLLIAHRETAAVLAKRDDLHTVLLDAEPAAWASAPTHAPKVTALHPQHPAYVIYTSGSTGQPKGVVNTHAGIDNRLQWMQQALQLLPEQTVLQKTPVGFDVSVWELFWPLRVGARLVLAQPGGHKDPTYLIELIEQAGIDTVHFVPSMLRVFMDALPHGACLTLKRIICSGEALPADLALAVRERLPQVRLYNLYGPTEAAVDVSIWECTDADRSSVPIGRPIANTRLHVLDAHRALAPIGVAGELQIAGVQLARGYLGRPDLTAERFVPDPFAEQPGQRMYRTGDLACWRANGALDYLGRNDDQVKLRGFRIELGEIAAALRACACVDDAAVLLREDTPGAPRLVAYLIGDAEQLSADTLRTQLATRLPEVMLPTAYVILETLPLTANGKLDRRALPAPDADALAVQVYVAPEGEREILLASLWSELLDVEQIGRHDSFFALGGHSLMAISLIERLRRHGWQLEVRALFNSPTLAGLASTLTPAATVSIPPNRIWPGCTDITPALLPLVQLTQRQIDAAVATVEGGAANVQDIYPLAALQEGLLFHHLASSEGDAYLNISVLAFDTRNHLDAFVAALEAVIARHDILRTSFAWQGLPTPVQVVWRQARLPLQVLTIDAPDVLAELRLRMDSSTYRMDVSQAPLIHAHLVEDPRQQCWLLGLQTHHLVIDHTTLELLVAEVQAHLDRRQDQLPEPLPFRNFVAQARLGVSEDQHRAFFTQQLSDFDSAAAPFGRQDAHGNGTGIEQANTALPAALCKALRLRARRLDVSPASLFHLAYALVLAQASGQSDVVFGTALFGRMHAGSGADRVLGMFLNTLPIRLQRDGRGVADAVRQTQQQLAQLLHHEHASLALAQRCSGVAAPTPLFTTLINYRYAGGSAVQAPIETAQSWPDLQALVLQERTHYPLTLSIDDIAADGGFALEVQADQRIGAERVAAMLLQAVQVMLQALEQSPDTALHALDLLPIDERAQLQTFNATDAELDGSGYLHRAIEAQARRTPQAIALVEENIALSYAELDMRANQLAHHLIDLGVTPEDRVAVCLPRGIDLVVALLAVLKAGAAYLPLDGDVPSARLDGMLTDAGPGLLIAHRETAAVLAKRDDLHTVLLDAEPAAWTSAPTHAPKVTALHPQHPAYVIYTSGSTGQPKGVINTHAGIDNRLQWMQQALQLLPEQTVLQKTPVGFDVSVWELFWPLRVGARLVLTQPGGHKDPTYLINLIEQAGVDTVHFVPSMLRVFLDALPHGACLTLKRIICSGEALPADLALAVRERLPQVRLYNLYGPTEAAVDVSIWECTDADRSSVPIGRPIANTRLHVLDAHRTLAPIGVAGELQIAGVQLARGYLGRPDLTAERFVPDPFAEQPGQRMYRTGDLACWRANGALDYLGRNDDQVKLRGFRIELGEIAAALRACAGVDDAAVLLREDTPGEPRLVAYLIGDAEQLSADTLRTQLATRLPEVMLPTAYVILETLPLTANGKLDRRALPAPDADALAVQAYTPPQGALEQTLAQLWRELLGVEQVGRHDSFFALGGHSLLGVRLISRIRSTLGLELPLAALFAQPR